MENSSPSQYERYSELMLKQKIIHLNSELAKYKSLVKDFRESYQYSRVEKLIEENKKLIELVNNYEKQPHTDAVVNENLEVQRIEIENLEVQRIEIENLELQRIEIEKSAVVEEDVGIQNDEGNSLITTYQEKIAQYEKKEKQWKKALKKMKPLQEENERLIRLNEELTDKLENEEEYYHNLLVRVSRLNSDLYNANSREQELQNRLSTLQNQLDSLQANSSENE